MSKNANQVPVALTTSNTAMSPQLLQHFPDGVAVMLEIVDGVPTFRASEEHFYHIASVHKNQKKRPLTASEVAEIEQYEQLADFLELVNSLVHDHFGNNSSVQPDFRDERAKIIPE